MLTIGCCAQAPSSASSRTSPSPRSATSRARGLLTPSRTRSGYRLFNESDIERLRRVLELQRDEYPTAASDPRGARLASRQRTPAAEPDFAHGRAEIDLAELCRRAQLTPETRRRAGGARTFAPVASREASAPIPRAMPRSRTSAPESQRTESTPATCEPSVMPPIASAGWLSKSPRRRFTRAIPNGAEPLSPISRRCWRRPKSYCAYSSGAIFMIW